MTTPIPPESATVSVPALPRVAGGVQLSRVMPRYRPITTIETREMRSVSACDPSPQTQPHFCFICGKATPPWRASCFSHDQRQGRGLPRAIMLQQ